MAKDYLPVDREHPFLLPPSVQEFMPEDDLAWFLIDAVATMDTSRFHVGTQRGWAGRAGYDPDMMLTLLLYAYCLGQRSSRRIEALCGRDLGFKLVTGNRVIDHSTIATFRAKHEGLVGDLFAQVLLLCAKEGLRQIGVVAIDGTKIAAAAGLGKTRERETLQREYDRLRVEVDQMLAEAATIDAQQDALFGPQNRGDELPKALRHRVDRLTRLRESLRQIDQARAEHDAREHGPTPTGRPRRTDKVATAQRRLDRVLKRREERLALEAALGEHVRPSGRRPDFETRIAKATAELEATRAEAAGRAEPDPHLTTSSTEPLPHTTPGTDPATPATPGTDLVLRPGSSVEHLPTTPASTPGTDPATPATPGTDLVLRPGSSVEHLPSAAHRGNPGTDPATPATPGTDLVLRPGCSVEHLPSAAHRGNPTDPDSRLLKTQRGWIQGFNCQAAVVRVQGGRRLVLAAAATQDANDTGQAMPMLAAAAANAELAGLGPITLAALDAGYWSEHNLTAPGPDRLIASGKHHTMIADLRANGYAASQDAPPPDASPGDKMRHRLRTHDGAEAYAQRAPTVEPTFGDLKHNRGVTRFQRRGTPAADSEWKLVNLASNLRTLHLHNRDLSRGRGPATKTGRAEQTKTTEKG